MDSRLAIQFLRVRGIVFAQAFDISYFKVVTPGSFEHFADPYQFAVRKHVAASSE